MERDGVRPVNVEAEQLLACRWRVGRKLGVTIYAQTGAEEADDDVLLALFDSAAGPDIAAFVVGIHNSAVANGVFETERDA